jgi:predicted flap endonuclease-1-like 5' DNA nuclease
LDRILIEARHLARETRSLGRVWNAEPPDDLTAIPGINERYLARLFDAGVCTFHALAGTSLQELDYICQPPAFDKPNYQSWIDQARGRLAS